MAWLTDIWPFVPGQQRMIFHFGGLIVLGLIALNIFSALRQGLPLQEILSSHVPSSNIAEKRVRIVLVVLLLLSFLALGLDIHVNGLQLIDPNWTSAR